MMEESDSKEIRFRAAINYSRVAPSSREQQSDYHQAFTCLVIFLITALLFAPL